MIAVIDYGAGNLGSVVNALRHLGVEHVVSDDPARILAADGVIFPGVGATADTMANLQARGLVPVIAAAVEQERPFLGICVGQQVLFSASHEGPRHDCLDILRGEVRRFPDDLIVPHMGWNGVAAATRTPSSPASRTAPSSTSSTPTTSSRSTTSWCWARRSTG